MELKYTESFAENMRELGFKIKYYMGTPAAYYDGMAIEFEEDYYGSISKRHLLSSICRW